MAGVIIDTSNPHLWVTFFPESTTIIEYEASVEELVARNPKRELHAILMDMRASKAFGATAKARRRATEVMEQHREHFEACLVGSARVAPDPIFRGILTVYDFVAPGSWPRKVFRSGAAAESWARGLLEARGVSVGPRPVWRD